MIALTSPSIDGGVHKERAREREVNEASALSPHLYEAMTGVRNPPGEDDFDSFYL